MEKFLIALLFVGGCFFGALAEYVAGRVLLPAMGLTAPGHWTWCPYCDHGPGDEDPEIDPDQPPPSLAEKPYKQPVVA